jgi:hypothetical protein
MKLGDRVWWLSHARGHWTRKIGVVVLVVPPGQPVINVLSRRYDLSSIKGGVRKDESYLVEVLVEGRRPVLYWPRVHWLQKLAAVTTGALR